MCARQTLYSKPHFGPPGDVVHTHTHTLGQRRIPPSGLCSVISLPYFLVIVSLTEAPARLATRKPHESSEGAGDLNTGLHAGKQVLLLTDPFI